MDTAVDSYFKVVKDAVDVSFSRPSKAARAEKFSVVNGKK